MRRCRRVIPSCVFSLVLSNWEGQTEEAEMLVAAAAAVAVVVVAVAVVVVAEETEALVEAEEKLALVF